jgi:hypothetical protein
MPAAAGADPSRPGPTGGRTGPVPLPPAGPVRVRVQCVLYGNQPGRVACLLAGLDRSAELATRAGLARSVGVWFGDCSTRPCLADADLDRFRSRHRSLDRVEYRFFGTNLGHADGQNRLLALAAGEEATLITNPDTYPAPGLLGELLAALAEPGTAVAEARQVPFEHPKHHDPETGRTSWASAACSLFRSGVLREVGGFDAASFFLHGDDVDLSWRIRLAGHHVRHQPSAAIFHDKRIDRGRVEQGPGERLHSACAAMMLGYKWSRPDVVDHWLRWFAASDDPAYNQAARWFQERLDSGRLPHRLDAEGVVGEFVESFYAVHRF